ncbi:non-functional pseudokinase ZED1-like [Durio zibethinus]|uniref:Non-functional pseudokinase ZED1-like n=1 Tax=Durio zibethinus TaxID=66656 RepID=A0A6P5WWV9_DURZI|nr:non-functional pseudokinase ZED1-like [Durio zibethinus]
MRLYITWYILLYYPVGNLYNVQVLGKMISCLKVKRHDKDETEEGDKTFFTKNGGALLEELIALRNGKSNPIRRFSAKELLIATNNYHGCQIFVKDCGYQLYKGSLKDRPIVVKTYGNDQHPRAKFAGTANPYKDIAIGSQMSVHNNVLKVIGCCLETQQPTVVYEFVGTKSLSTCISATNNVEPLPWKCRLKIAKDLANAIAYLHTAFSRPVIHRDIKSSNIILDQNNVPKITDFGLSISIPEGQLHVQCGSAPGIKKFIPPEYLVSGYLTEKVDVYNFGMLLFELLSGQEPSYYLFKVGNVLHSRSRCVEKLGDVVDCRIRNEGFRLEQFQGFNTLLLRCISHDEEERPTMTEVAKELRLIHQNLSNTLL